ncbi:LemA family protein [Chthoniobacter flavus]|nr:LemA family protein [Chthoniobacter flavus]
MNEKAMVVTPVAKARKGLVAKIAAGVAILILVAAVAVGYSPVRKLRASENTLNSRWTEVEALCERRAEIGRNLVPLLSSAEKLDKQWAADLSRTQANAELCRIEAKRAPVDAGQFGAFQQSQRDLNTAISRALAAVARDPQLKQDPKLRKMTAEYLTVGKDLVVRENNFVHAGLLYNHALRQRPANIYGPLLGFRPRLYLERTNGEPAQAAVF